MRLMHKFQVTAYFALLGLFFVTADRALAETGTVEIVSVKSLKATQGSNSDEIYFLFNGKRIPASSSRDIKVGDTWNLNSLIAFKKKIVIKLYEADTIGDDDLIGAIAIKASDGSGQRTELMTGDSSKYVVVLEVNRNARTEYNSSRNQSKSIPNQSKTCRYYQEFQRHGAVHELPANVSQSYVGDFWHDKISSYEISPGCRLQAFVDRDFSVPSKTFYGSKDLPPDWNGRISSVKCNC